MKKIDLHVHSCYSNQSSLILVNTLDIKESYTLPETIYKKAKAAGMDFVTITDHNTIDGVLLLQKNHPEDVILGSELSCFFPNDNCEVHILVYGFTEAQFKDMNLLRFDIYSLRSYLFRHHIPYSVAHATYPANGKLTFQHLEELLLMFSVFESINGCRSKVHNETWTQSILQLSEEKMKELQNKYSLNPVDQESWKKGLTGGSDDHAGLFIASTYTEADCNTKEEFLEALLNKKTSPQGRNNDFVTMAFSIFNIVCEVLKQKKSTTRESLFEIVSETILHPESLTMKKKLKLFLIRIVLSKKHKKMKQFLSFLVQLNRQKLPSGQRFNQIFQQISDSIDCVVMDFASCLSKNLKSGDLPGLAKSLFRMSPEILSSLPFLFTSQQLHVRNDLIQELKKNYLKTNLQPYSKKILWFTDTINDLNGVSATLNELGWQAYHQHYPITMVASIEDSCQKNHLPPNLLNLESIYQFNLPYYESYLLKVPSFLSSLQKIYEESPDEIVISTPGPIGLLGCLIAKVMKIKCVGVFHTDFVLQAKQIIQEDIIITFLEKYIHWFYSQMDEVRVTTKEYANILESRGVSRSKLRFLPKGIDPDLFTPVLDVSLCSPKKDTGDFQLLYAGRISKDKNLDFLISVFEKILTRNPNAKLKLVGEGPYLEDLKAKHKHLQGLQFYGKVSRKDLPKLYSFSDLLLFPSTTDTFGMVVLEAQACGLPVIVTNQGGPKEIIKHGTTGLILEANHIPAWVESIEKLINLRENQPETYQKWRLESRTNAIQGREWKTVLASL